MWRRGPIRIAILAALAAVSGAPAAANAQCQPEWSGLNGGANWEVRALATFDDDGSGPLPPALYAGGGFDRLAGVDLPFIARWDGWSASKVGAGLSADLAGLYSLLAVAQTVGAVPAGLYAGGEIDVAGSAPVNNLARWLAPHWHDVGGGVTSPGILASFVFAMEVFDEDGVGPEAPALFVGGQFEFAGGVPAEGLARWDGAKWSVVGGGLATKFPGETEADAKALAVYDDGRGPALYVGGSFDYAGGDPAANIARWDGTAWETVGPGLASTVNALHVFDEDGPGPKRPALFAGGVFTSPVGGSHGDLYHIGRWDGAEWTEVGDWISDGAILSMAVWDEDGPSPAPESLYVGGSFNILPDLTPVANVARWDGRRWWDVGGGVTGFGAGTRVSAMAAYDEDGPGPNPGGLYVGGLFYEAGAVHTQHIARWGCPLPPAPPCPADCDGDGELTFFDFLCFQNQFAFGDLRADCDGDGSLTFFDFLCFQNQFSAGCS
ncbi:MAG: GC-type dockerin domain-anchored protein [Phycisphaerales bacterium JB039]